MLVGLVLRVLAARGDLWLDEILTLFVATSTPSWGALLNVHHDNVHLLTALWLRFVGANAPAMLCRLPSIVASTATIALAAWYMRPVGRGAAIGSAWLLAVSLMQVQYGSEARGYALAGAFMVACFELVARLGDRPSWPLRACLAVMALLGVASHLTFMFVLPALLIAAFAGALPRVSWSSALGSAVRDAGPACALAAAFAIWALRGMVVAGGMSRPVLDVAGSAFALGSPAARHGFVLLVVTLVVSVSLALLSCRRDAPSVWPRRLGGAAAGLAAIAVAPTLFLIAHPPEFVHERYLYLSVAGSTILLGGIVGLPLMLPLSPTAPMALRALPAALMVGVACMVAAPSVLLIASGRGDFRAAVVRARQEAQGGALTLAGSNDFRTKAMLAYVIPRMPPGPEVRYVEADQSRTQPPDFWLEHVPTWDRSEARPNIELGGSDYLLVDEYPAYGLSGFTWRLYRRLSPPSGS
jgi:hypothetical protein